MDNDDVNVNIPMMENCVKDVFDENNESEKKSESRNKRFGPPRPEDDDFSLEQYLIEKESTKNETPQFGESRPEVDDFCLEQYLNDGESTQNETSRLLKPTELNYFFHDDIDNIEEIPAVKISESEQHHEISKTEYDQSIVSETLMEVESKPFEGPPKPDNQGPPQPEMMFDDDINFSDSKSLDEINSLLANSLDREMAENLGLPLIIEGVHKDDDHSGLSFDSHESTIRSDALRLILSKIENAKADLAEPITGDVEKLRNEISNQIEMAQLIEKLASATLSSRRKQEEF